MAQGDSKSDVILLSIGAAVWGYQEVRPPVGETWKVVYAKAVMRGSATGCKVGLALYDGTNSIDLVAEVADTTPGIECKEELFIDNSNYLRFRGYNASGTCNLEVLVSALQIK